jgi:hypothetical protein
MATHVTVVERELQHLRPQLAGLRHFAMDIVHIRLPEGGEAWV